MTFLEIVELLKTKFEDTIINKIVSHKLMSFIEIKADNLLKVSEFLYSNENLYFDSLSCITALDNGVEKNTMEMVYNFYSITNHHFFCIKVILDRNNPQIESLSSIWKTANWHEREAFDLLGISVINHPDLRRILNPEDWQGHPLRKDYEVQETYHDIKVKY